MKDIFLHQKIRRTYSENLGDIIRNVITHEDCNHVSTTVLDTPESLRKFFYITRHILPSLLNPNLPLVDQHSSVQHVSDTRIEMSEGDVVNPSLCHGRHQIRF